MLVVLYSFQNYGNLSVELAVSVTPCDIFVVPLTVCGQKDNKPYNSYHAETKGNTTKRVESRRSESKVHGKVKVLLF